MTTATEATKPASDNLDDPIWEKSVPNGIPAYWVARIRGR